MSLKLFIILLIVVSNDILSVNAECSIELKDLIKKFQPVYIDPTTNGFFYPFTDNQKQKDVFQLAEKQHLNLWCSKGFTNTDITQNLITVTCEGGSIKYGGTSYANINSFECKGWPELTYRRTGKACYNSGTQVDVEFQINNLRLKIYTVCFDATLENTHYVHYNLMSLAAQKGVEEPKWEQTDFFPGKIVDNLYKEVKQEETISAIFGDKNAGKHFIDKPNQFFMSRGHMAAKNDFIYASHQRATYHFINIAPQWHSFNEGNWIAVEDWSKHAAKVHKGLEVYTGTFDILNLEYNSVKRNMFLDFTPDSSSNGRFDGQYLALTGGLSRGISRQNLGLNRQRFGQTNGFSPQNYSRNFGQVFVVSRQNYSRNFGQAFLLGRQNYSRNLEQTLGFNRQRFGQTYGFSPQNYSRNFGQVFVLGRQNYSRNFGQVFVLGRQYYSRNFRQTIGHREQRSGQNTVHGGQNIEKIPVPKFYYKILLDNIKKQGVVFFGYNNPFMLESQANCDAVCPNQNSNMKFNKAFNSKILLPKQGIICTCLVKDFLEAVPHVNLGSTVYTLMVTKN